MTDDDRINQSITEILDCAVVSAGTILFDGGQWYINGVPASEEQARAFFAGSDIDPAAEDR